MRIGREVYAREDGELVTGKVIKIDKDDLFIALENSDKIIIRKYWEVRKVEYK